MAEVDEVVVKVMEDECVGVEVGVVVVDDEVGLAGRRQVHLLAGGTGSCGRYSEGSSWGV